MPTAMATESPSHRLPLLSPSLSTRNREIAREKTAYDQIVSARSYERPRGAGDRPVVAALQVARASPVGRSLGGGRSHLVPLDRHALGVGRRTLAGIIRVPPAAIPANQSAE